MVNYACPFSPSELEKYFEWIIKIINAMAIIQVFMPEVAKV